jgi:hypothetical protein
MLVGVNIWTKSSSGLEPGLEVFAYPNRVKDFSQWLRNCMSVISPTTLLKTVSRTFLRALELSLLPKSFRIAKQAIPRVLVLSK